MNLELGKYAADVLLAYSIGLAALIALVAAYALRNARVRRALEKAEGNRS